MTRHDEIVWAFIDRRLATPVLDDVRATSATPYDFARNAVSTGRMGALSSGEQLLVQCVLAMHGALGPSLDMLSRLDDECFVDVVQTLAELRGVTL